MSNQGKLFVCVAMVTFAWLTVHVRALNYYWFNDDLHLIRMYSEGEIKGAFAGTWDPDNIETDGYRPFTTLFNHIRYSILGEAPYFHRLFAVFLMAGALWMVGQIALNLGMKLSNIFFGFLIFVSTKTLTNDIIWISDNIHIFEYFLVSASILSLFVYIDQKKSQFFIISLLCAILALLTREESLVIIVIVPFLIVYKALSAKQKVPEILFSTGIMIYFGIMILSVALIFIIRGRVVPDSPGFSLGITAIKGFLDFLIWSGLIVGDFVTPGETDWGMQTGSTLLSQITILYVALLLSTTVFYFFVGSTASKKRILGLSVLWAVACSPGIIMTRPNLLFLPTLIFSLMLAIMGEDMISLAGKLPSYKKVFLYCSVLALFFVAIAGSTIRASYQRMALSPYSVNTILGEYIWIYGIRSERNPTIPSERIAQLKEKLSTLGINAPFSSVDEVRSLLLNQVAQNQNLPDRENKIFTPVVAYMIP